MNNSTAKAKPKMTVKNGVVYGDALSAQEKKRIVMQKKKDRKAKKVRKSAQQTIPYVEMCRDGICKVNSRLYTKSIAFEDINYQLAQNEDKTAIFENWCDFLNYFDSSIFVQLSFINQKASLNEFRKRINIPAQEDAFNDIRSEYSGMLQSQLTKGNNGLVKKKYITFGIEADSLRTAKPKLERIETDILNNFKTLGVRTEPLSGYERLKVLHDVFNMDSNEPFRFSFDMVARTGLSSKDFIAPTSFDFREGKCFKMGRTIGAVSFLQILAPELNDRMLADFLEMDSNITVNFHIRTIDQAKAIKSIAGFRQAIPARVHHMNRHNGGSRTVIVVHVFGIVVFKRFGSQLALSAGAADLARLFCADFHGDEISEQRVICIRVDLRHAVDVVFKTF